MTGRFSRATDKFPEQECWPALYVALGPHVAVLEGVRHMSRHLANITDCYLTELSVTLSYVLDCRDLAALGIIADDLLDDRNYTLGHQLAGAALALGAEAIVVPSATRVGDNLIILTQNLRSTAHIAIVRADLLDHALIP